jgi:hypothetical protein
LRLHEYIPEFSGSLFYGAADPILHRERSLLKHRSDAMGDP